MKALSLLFLFIAAVEVCAQTIQPDELARLRQSSLADLTNIQLNRYANLLSQDSTPIGEKVAALAEQCVGQVFPMQPVHTDNLKEGNMTVVAMRCLALANARNWDEYYSFLLRLHFREPVPAEATRIRWYPAEWAKSANWILESATKHFPETRKVWYTYWGWSDWKKTFRPDYNLPNKRERIVIADLSAATLARLNPGDLVFFMRKRGVGDFKDVDVGICVAGSPVQFVRTRIDKSASDITRTIVLDGVPPQLDGKYGDGLIVYRPVQVSDQARTTISQRMAELRSIIPSAQSADSLLLGSRLTPWFNVPID